MAERTVVKARLRQRIRENNPDALMQAGRQWEEMPMSHYYLTEKQVNDAIEDVMKSAIHFPDKDLSDDRWRELKEKVNLDTPAKTAIDTTTDISAFAKSPVPVP